MVNKAYAELFGKSVVELEGNSFFPLIAPNDPEDVKAVLQSLYEVGDEHTLEHRVVGPDGDVTWMEWTNKRVSPVANSPIEYQAIGRDITDRKLAQIALAESESKYRKIFEEGAIGLARVAPDGQWLEVNQVLCDLVGFSKSELLGMTFQDITHPEDLDADLSQVSSLLEGKSEQYQMEKRYICKDGSVVWISLTVSCLRNEEGSIEYFISAIQDISQRVKAIFKTGCAPEPPQLKRQQPGGADRLRVISWPQAGKH